MSDRKVNVAIVGLGFGAEFIPIYQRHPNANIYAICQRTKEKLDQVGDAFGIEKRYASFEELLKDPNVEAVHINTPIHLHAPQSVAASRPANTSPAPSPPPLPSRNAGRSSRRRARQEELHDGETVVYSREFLYVRELRTRASWAGSSSCGDRICRTCMAGRATGKGCPQCITPPTASAHAWPSSKARPTTFPASARAGLPSR